MELSKAAKAALEAAVDAIVKKYPKGDDDDRVLTDIHVMADAEAGKFVLLDDDDNEIFSTVVEEWADYADDDFYPAVKSALRSVCLERRKEIDSLSLVKPFTVVLMGSDREYIADIYNADDENIIVDEDLMKGLDEDLDSFIDRLLDE